MPDCAATARHQHAFLCLVICTNWVRYSQTPSFIPLSLTWLSVLLQADTKLHLYVCYMQWLSLIGRSDLRYTFPRIHQSAELGKRPGSQYAVKQGCVRQRDALWLRLLLQPDTCMLFFACYMQWPSVLLQPDTSMHPFVGQHAMTECATKARHRHAFLCLLHAMTEGAATARYQNKVDAQGTLQCCSAPVLGDDRT